MWICVPFPREDLIWKQFRSLVVRICAQMILLAEAGCSRCEVQREKTLKHRRNHRDHRFWYHKSQLSGCNSFDIWCIFLSSFVHFLGGYCGVWGNASSGCCVSATAWVLPLAYIDILHLTISLCQSRVVYIYITLYINGSEMSLWLRLRVPLD